MHKDGKVVYVHREVLAAKVPAPSPFAFCLHSCDIKCCCEETHLRWGTHAENMLEAKARNRFSRRAKVRGSEVHTARLTEDDVRYIRASELSNRELDKMFSLTPGHSWRIRNNKVWRHVEQTLTSTPSLPSLPTLTCWSHST